MKIKILYVADTFLPKKDGVVRFMIETYKRLSSNYKASFLVPRLKGSETAARTLNLNAYFVPTRKFKVADYPPALPKSNIVKRAIDYSDLIFINSIGPLGSSALKYAKKIKKPIIEFVHSIDWELFAYGTRFPDKAAGLLKPIVRRLYNKSDIIIVADKNIAVFLRGSGIKSKIKIVPLGVNQKIFEPDRIKRLYMREKLNWTDKYIIGYHGRLSTEKNIKLLVKIFKLAKKQIPNAALLIVGDGHERENIPKNKDIIVTGFVDNPEDYLDAMDVYIMPSMTETTGLSVMEAMASGLPVIASAVGAIPHYIEDNKNGILINRNSLKAGPIVNAIKKFYDSIRYTINIKNNASQTIRNFYTWDKTTEKLEDIFRKVLK